MNILVTGANGFIAKNLIQRLKENNFKDITEFNKGNSLNDLKKSIASCDAIFHLAGVNRPSNENDFKSINEDLTQLICNFVIENKKNIPIFFSSSTQFDNGSLYGNSKLNAENIIQSSMGSQLKTAYIYRLPGVFGKWAKPNYNSVVSTFCNNIANDIPIKIDDRSMLIDLVFIDDLVELFLFNLNNIKEGIFFPKIKKINRISVGELSDQIHKFKESKENLILEKVGSGLTRALYSTYITYLPKSKFIYRLKSHDDKRGSFVEMAKTLNSGQFSYFTAHPGVTRGLHYHHTKTEKFLVIQGNSRFRFKNIITNEYHEIYANGEEPSIVETIPGWSHDIKNIGDSILIVMLWANEIFDLKNPDTFQSEINQ